MCNMREKFIQYCRLTASIVPGIQKEKPNDQSQVTETSAHKLITVTGTAKAIVGSRQKSKAINVPTQTPVAN